MFSGSAEELKQTKVTQPAVFLHSVVKHAVLAGDVKPDAVAGHSLGEFSALVVAGVLSFEDGLKLVNQRALAMQKACEANPGTMAAVLGLADEAVEEICKSINDDVVVAANYNCPGQLVISGSLTAVERACELLKAKGAKRALILQVGGAFHSPLMMPAQEELAEAIDQTKFFDANALVYQNVDALPYSDANTIKGNLIKQLTSPVRWTQTIQHMIEDQILSFTECGGTGKVLLGMIRQINKDVEMISL
jgi:[acyl-carrier-protein] S-malonyltransferase